MSATSEYLRKTAHDERNFYRTQLQQNWIAPLQSAALLLSGPYLFKQALEYIPDFGAFAYSQRLMDFFIAVVLIYPIIAIILLGFQLWPQLPIREERELSLLPMDEEKVRLHDIPIELCPREVQELILEIIRLRMIPILIEEVFQLRRQLNRRGFLQQATTFLILIPVLIYAILFAAHR